MILCVFLFVLKFFEYIPIFFLRGKSSVYLEQKFNKGMKYEYFELPTLGTYHLCN